MRLRLFLPLLLTSCANLPEEWVMQPDTLGWTPVEIATLEDSGLRAISLPESHVIWIAGAKGRSVTSRDGGETWSDVSPQEAREDDLDLRSIHAFGRERAIAVSAGPGEASRILRTTDGGESWETVHLNRDPEGFFDSVAFWNERVGVCFGDPTEGRLTILLTRDGGDTWERVPAESMPAGVIGEAGFAASNGCIALLPGGLGWIGTGGTEARVLSTRDYGATWTAVRSPLRSGGTATGIFALAFHPSGDGVVVGGEYTDPANAAENCATSKDGGQTWVLSEVPPRGYRSSVIPVPRTQASWLAVGITGTDVSLDGGATWQPLGEGADLELNAVRVTPDAGTAWAVGPKGRVLRMSLR